MERALCGQDAEGPRPLPAHDLWSALDEWNDQDRAEWVVLLAGSAGLILEGKSTPLLLEPGSYVHIGIVWTEPSVPTFWLAIHYQ